MMIYMCRFCKELLHTGDNYVSYGKGHAHWNCKLDSLKTRERQQEWLSELRVNQIEGMPHGVVHRSDWMPDFLRSMLAARRSAQ